MRKKIISFLVSGRGSNFRAVAENIVKGNIFAILGIVISDNRYAKALDIAKDFGMKAFFVDPSSYPNREEHDKAMARLFREYKTDLIVAAGYMRILTPYFVRKFKNRILNIHPALLPSFPGVHAQEQALNKGVKITGCTTHFIDEGVDTGPIIMQSPVPVHDDDTLQTLAEKILKEEHRILPESVKLFCEDRLKIVGEKTVIIKR